MYTQSTQCQKNTKQKHVLVYTGDINHVVCDT